MTRSTLTHGGIVAAIVMCLASRAGAQDRPAPSLDIEAGWVGFADDGIVSETLAGAAARWYLLSRISVGPEIVYLASEHHSHLIVTGNLTFDIRRERSGRRVIPFLVIGGGLFQTRDTFFDESYTSNEGAFTAGGGVRIVINERVTTPALMRAWAGNRTCVSTACLGSGWEDNDRAKIERAG